MKRNVAPLLAIAFIVAAISTGVFYGLFAGRLRAASADLPQRALVVAAHDLQRGTVLTPQDLRVSEIRMKKAIKGSFDEPRRLVGSTVMESLQENDPLTENVVALKDGSAAAGSGGIPPGMRAVSIHVYESSGVLGLLRRGSKVDIQAFLERNGAVEMSPVLQDIEVLATNPQPEPVMGGRATAPVVTVLTRPLESDILALADSGAHLRLALRNPVDNDTETRKALAIPMLFRVAETPSRRSGAFRNRTASSAMAKPQKSSMAR